MPPRALAPAASLFVALSLVPAPSATAADAPISGFSPGHAKWEREYERALSALPSASTARDLDAYLAREPGLVASTGDWRRVRYVVAKLKSYGLQPEVRTYYTYLSSPKSIQVQMTAPRRLDLPVKEKKQPWQQAFDKVVVGYNALSPAGEATAPVVYANYGRAQDYDVLAQNGVSVKGRIVLARYGQVFRGVKTRQAYLHGAAGLILYSDPADDGFTKGKVYPDGPWRAPDGIQRGSVGQIMYYSGDPLTPGWAATKGARRIKPADAAELPKGPPTTPISYGAAEPLLKNLTGKAVPASWQGGLPFTYHFGPGGTQAHLNLKIDYSTKPIWDVIAKVRGSEHPEQEVIVGGHRDTWTYGSLDDLSGTENVLQVARGLGRLLKQGWRPKRTIVLATWDGEEYGLYGSTEYAEERAAQLRRAVAYVNMDVAAGEFFGPAATPALDGLIEDATKQVHWPGTNGSLYDAWKQQNKGSTPISRIGGGSDFQSFFQRYGVPALDLGASSTGGSGNYHCSCDDHYWMARFGDPTWEYHVGMSQLVGIIALRLANADVIPMRYSPYAGEVTGYLNDFTQQQRNTFGSVKVDVSRDVTQAENWRRAASALESAAATALARGDTRTFGRLNAKLMRAERDLLTSAGLPDRPWYRHQIYAPGIDTGYATQRLPALHDALFLDNDVATAKAYEARLYAALQAVTRTLTT
jgi:N-acetylated-alpha-linked acidic dipeptidase